MAYLVKTLLRPLRGPGPPSELRLKLVFVYVVVGNGPLGGRTRAANPPDIDAISNSEKGWEPCCCDPV